MKRGTHQILIGDVRERLKEVAPVTVQMCVTSPPYWKLRSYLDDADPAKQFEIGNEPTPEEYIANLVTVFRLVREALHPTGTLWLNLGDSYNSEPGKRKANDTVGPKQETNAGSVGAGSRSVESLKPGELCNMPHRVAEALQKDGWFWRSTIVWAKKCLSGGTWLYARTAKGDAPAMLKDLVRLRPETVKLWDGQKWVQVVGWARTPERDDRRHLEIEFRNGERVGCTADHRWPTKRGVLAADELELGDVVLSCRLPAPKASMPMCIDEAEFGWLCGFYLAEGCSTPKGVMFAINAKETEAFERIRRVAESLGGTAKMQRRAGCAAAVVVYCKALRELLKDFIPGKNCHNKRLSRKSWMRDDTFLDAVLSGYLEGDGHWDAKIRQWSIGFCNNDGLAVDLRCLCARLGKSCRIRRVTHKTNGRNFPGWRGRIRTASSHHNAREAGEIVAIRASRAREFWDVAVDQEPNLFALSSGILTHNSPMPESISGWRWRRCRVKIKSVGNEADGWQRSPRTYDPAIGGQRYTGAEWLPCPGCKKCTATGGYVLRKGRWRPTTAHEYLFLFSKGRIQQRSIQFADLEPKRVHFGQDLGAQNAPLEAESLCVKLASAFFYAAQTKRNFSLPPFYSEEWKDCTNRVGRDDISSLPAIERLAGYSARLLQADLTTKEFLKEVNSLRAHLAEDDHLLISRILAQRSLSPSGFVDNNATIAINDASEVCKIDFAHNCIIYQQCVSSDYFCDGDAVQELAVGNAPRQQNHKGRDAHRNGDERLRTKAGLADVDARETRNPRSVWTLSSEGFKGAHFACVDDATEALTPTGWKKHQDLADGDLIAAYSKEFDRIEWQPASFHRYDFDGELVAVEKRDTSQRLTPNHRCIVRKRTKRGHDVKVVEAAQLNSRMNLLMTAEWGAPTETGIGLEMAELIGWFVAEGERKRGNIVRIYQSESANPAKVSRIRGLLTSVGAEFKEYRRQRTVGERQSVEITFAVRGQIANRLAEVCPDKKIPWWACDLPLAEAKAMLAGVVDGDGHRRADGRSCIIQKDRDGCERMQVLAIRCGYRALMKPRAAGDYSIYLTSGKWLTLRGGNGVGVSVGREHYTGVVWCPSVRSGFWLARRNGMPFITGNTYPSELVKRCLLAATSAAGCCPTCRTPYAPVVESVRVPTRPGQNTKIKVPSGWDTAPGAHGSFHRDGRGEPEYRERAEVGNRDHERHIAVTRTVGHRPCCRCNSGGPIPSLILDPFGGSGTTAQVATWYGRDAVIVELNPEYAALAEARVATMPRCMVRELGQAKKKVRVAPAGATLFDRCDDPATPAGATAEE